VLTSDKHYKRLAAFLGLTRYNTLIERLGSKVSTYSPYLGKDVTFLLEGSTYHDKPLQGPSINTTPVTNVDLVSLPDGVTALKADKVTVHDVYLSAAHAAHELDGKVENLYIKRYINVDKQVKTSAGSFYFVQRLDYVAPTHQFRDGVTKGAKIPVIMYDPRYSIYVRFETKSEVSLFIWGERNLSQALDRYLARLEEKPIVLFKNTLAFYYPSNLPKGAVPITAAQYYNTIGAQRYIHQRL